MDWDLYIELMAELYEKPEPIEPAPIVTEEQAIEEAEQLLES